jgi:hypothetical protein
VTGNKGGFDMWVVKLNPDGSGGGGGGSSGGGGCSAGFGIFGLLALGALVWRKK